VTWTSCYFRPTFSPALGAFGAGALGPRLTARRDTRLADVRLWRRAHMKISGSTFLVTGASSGIGAALAPILAARGATGGIVARRRERLDEVLARCVEHAPDSRRWVADRGDLELAERVALEAWDAFGGVDCLVNNAGIPKRTRVDRLTPEVVAQVMDVNVHSPVRMTL